jgi:uncharacterized membrane protein YgcG
VLGRIGVWRHVAVAVVVLGISLLAAIGVIGRGNLPERFESKVVTVQPAGDDGVRIREVVDQDFGTKDRHGYERIIPTDFGSPVDIEASSPDANADIDVTAVATGDRIRLGDPNTTFTGQHRYILSYTLPDAQLSTGRLDLNIIGDPRKPETLETGRFEVIVAGLELSDPTCQAGAAGATGGCTLSRVGDVYRTVISPLKPGQGITIRGTITGRLAVAKLTDPPAPTRRPDHRWLLALATLAIGAVVAGITYVSTRRSGRNEVFAGGAADAAYGTLPQPSQGGAPPMAVRMVADSKMDELATIEFVPPKGIDPWQGSVLLNEKIDRGTIAAWISGLVAKDAITLTKDGDDVVLARGPRIGQLDSKTQTLVNQMLDYKEELALGSYNANFGKAWAEIQTLERDSIAASGWWKRLPPGTGSGCSASTWLVTVFILFAFFGGGSLVAAIFGAFRGTIPALLFAVLVPAITAHFLYRLMAPARSATGSALTLRAESFRRFLAASEGQHVDWAWKQGLLREYSAWAVALGAADAWGKALAHSNVPAPEMNMASPLWLYSMGPSFDSTRSAPAPSGGSGGSSFGGGFSGGVGGGGGGGSSGSW